MKKKKKLIRASSSAAELSVSSEFASQSTNGKLEGFSLRIERANWLKVYNTLKQDM